MAFREVTMVEIREVVRQWLSGKGIKTVARALAMDPKTVRRYVRAAESVGIDREAGPDGLDDEHFSALLAKLAERPDRSDSEGRVLCVRHRDFIESKLRARVRLTKVHRLLARQGAVVSYSTLYRFAVDELAFGKRTATVPVADGEPGQEVAVDVGTITLPEPGANGRRRSVKCFLFTPNVSRYRFLYVAESETTEAAIAAFEAAWRFYGGMFAVALVDNAKSIIDQADPLGARVNDVFLEYAQARGFLVDTTRVRDPRGKARVERSVRHTRDDCFAGENISEAEAAQQRATYWCEHEYGMRRHSTTGRMPKEHFEAEEAPRLKPAPTEPYDTPHWCEPKVARDHLAQVLTAVYSLPTRFIGQRLRARADSRTVRFYHHSVVVKVHPRQQRGGRSIDQNDFPKEKRGYAMRDVDFLRRQAVGMGESIGMMADKLLAGALPWTKMRQVYALLGLTKRHGTERVEDACRRALRADMHDARRIARMVESCTPTAPNPPLSDNIIPIGRYLRPKGQYALRRKHEEDK
jgi:transposase